MLPTPKSAHIDSAMSNISIAFKNQNFIADRVFQTIPVNKQSDYFYKFLKGAWFRLDADVRGPGSSARQSGYPITNDTYSCIEYALRHQIPIELINNADEVLRPVVTGVNFVTNAIQLKKEKIVSDLVTTAANWTSSNDAEGGWAAGDSNTFITDMLTAMETVRQLIGVKPNCLIMDSKTLNQLKQESTLLDKIKYTGTQGKPADVTGQTLAALFELDEVMIGQAIYSSDEETVAGTEFTAVDLWETTATKGSAFLYYRPPSPGIEVPAGGYVFNWKGDQGQKSLKVPAGGSYRSVRKWWDDDTKSYFIEANECFDAKVVGADAGYLFYDTIST